MATNWMQHWDHSCQQLAASVQSDQLRGRAPLRDILKESLFSWALSLSMNDWIFDSIVDALNDARSSVDLCSHIFTWLVIIGVVLETLFLGVDHHDDFKAWVFARTHFKIPWPEKPSWGKLFAEVFSVWLVVIGIWGEFYEGSRSARLETLARQVDGLRNTLLQQEAGDAATNARRAQDSAEAANESATNTQKKVEAIGRESQQLNGDLTEVRLFLSGRFVTHPDVIRKALGQRFGGWHFVSDANKAKLPPNSAPPALGMYMRFTSYIGDPEAYTFCTQLWRLADGSYVRAQNTCGSIPVPIAGIRMIDGILVSGEPVEDARDLAQILKDGGLTAVSFANPVNLPRYDSSALTVFVAHQEKPAIPKSIATKSPH